MAHKVFRIERTFGGGTASPAMPTRPATLGGEQTDAVPALRRELARLTDMIARNKRELAALVGDGHERRMAHAAGKLGAAVEGMEKATVTILKSAETIDDSARALAAAPKTDYERGLAQDIQDQVVKIYEACNFQDLAGQRIGNVIATLNTIEDRVMGLLARCKGDPAAAPAAKSASEREPLAGPRLDGASGHTSQRDIDALFG